VFNHLLHLDIIAQVQKKFAPKKSGHAKKDTGCSAVKEVEREKVKRAVCLIKVL